MMEDDLCWRTTFNGRQPLMEDNLWWNMTFNARPPMTFIGKKLHIERFRSAIYRRCGHFLFNQDNFKFQGFVSPGHLSSDIHVFDFFSYRRNFYSIRTLFWGCLASLVWFKWFFLGRNITIEILRSYFFCVPGKCLQYVATVPGLFSTSIMPNIQKYIYLVSWDMLLTKKVNFS